MGPPFFWGFMSVTQLSILNTALTRCGEPRISSLSQDTPSAIALNAIYDLARDTVMAAHPWNFAIKRDLLAPNATEPDFEYAYQYDKPADMLRLLTSDTVDADFVIEGDQILSDESELYVRYIYRNEDESSWSPGYASALAWYLAREVCYLLKQNSSLWAGCDAAYKSSLSEARSIDGAEGTMKGLSATSWTNARR